MAELDTFGEREEHGRLLARRYGLAPHGVDVHATLPRVPGIGRTISVVWIDSPAALLRAGLVVPAQVSALLANHADAAHRRTALQWVDEAGTRWVLSTNGGRRGDEHGLSLRLLYPDDANELPPRAATRTFTRAVERLVRAATGRPVRFQDLRDAATG
jgi:hypothetical protein